MNNYYQNLLDAWSGEIGCGCLLAMFVPAILCGCVLLALCIQAR